MRLAFNGTALLSPWAGVGQYTANLARQLVASPAVDAEFFYGSGWSPEVRSAPMPGSGSLLPLARRWIPRSYDLRRAFQNHRFRSHVRRQPFALYHEPNFLPLDFDGPTVVTVHDLSWMRFPQTHPPERVRALDRHFQRGLERATRLITDSEFVRTELIDSFGIRPDRINAIALAASDDFVPVSAADAAPGLARWGLTHGRFLLSVGTMEPRKNLLNVLRAYQRLPDTLRARHPLVLAGHAGWNNAELERTLGPLLASGQIHRLGYLSRTELTLLTASACTLVYPSLYEGFGLPPLEAMCCGVPPIISNASSLPEVAGDACLLVEANDPDEIARAMRQMIEHPELRNRLGALGRERAGQYSWTRCASQTIDIYRQALASR